MMKGILILLAMIAGFLAGGLIGSGTVSAGAGLAAGATVFVWGLGGAIVLLLVSIWIVVRLSATHVRTAVVVLSVAMCAVVLLLVGVERDAQGADSALTPASNTKAPEQTTSRYPHIQRSDLPAGPGILVLSPVPGSNLLFYAEPGVGQQPGDYPPVAEVRFGAAIPSVDILEAPAVFPFEEIRIHARPLDDSPVLVTTSESLQPIAVRGAWLKVSISKLADRMPSEGWLRWRDGERLSVGYKPLG